MQVNASIAVEHSAICPSVRYLYESQGDDGRMAYRLLIVSDAFHDAQPLPMQFANYKVALVAANTLHEAILQGQVPKKWNEIKEMLLRKK